MVADHHFYANYACILDSSHGSKGLKVKVKVIMNGGMEDDEIDKSSVFWLCCNGARSNKLKNVEMKGRRSRSLRT